MVGRRFGEASVPEGECGTCLFFPLYPGSRLTAGENYGNTSVRVAARCQLRMVRLVGLATVLGPPRQFSNLRRFWLARLVTRVNPRSAQISAELPN
jgi:hypothetical protein